MSKTEVETKSDTEQETPVPKRKREPQDDDLEIDINAAEPPSKKQLRKAKKQKLQESTRPANTDPSKNTSVKASSEKDEDTKIARSGHGIWIGNLTFATTKDQLVTFITSDAEYSISQDQVTRIHLPTGQPKNGKSQNKGFAYIDFVDESTVARALELSEKLLDGRRVLIKDANNFEGRPDKKKDGATITGKPPNRKIFVGNLAFDTTSEQLEHHFAACGMIQKVHVATFEDSGKCKGYAWVEFEDLSSAEAAMRGWVEKGIENGGVKMNKRRVWLQKMDGRTLRMEYAEDATTRYNKRHGKDANKRQSNQADGQVDAIEEVNDSTENTRSQTRPDKLRPSHNKKRYGYEEATVKKMTGAMTEGTGKKVVFD